MTHAEFTALLLQFTAIVLAWLTGFLSGLILWAHFARDQFGWDGEPGMPDRGVPDMPNIPPPPPKRANAELTGSKQPGKGTV